MTGRPTSLTRPGVRSSLLAGVLLALAVPGAAAQEASDPPPTITVGGYLRALSAVRHSVEAPDPWLAFHTQLARAAWTVPLGADASFSLHQLARLRVSSAPGTGMPIGLRTSRTRNRLVDLEWRVAADDGFELVHDVDRLALSLRLAGADVALGRQGITWGLAYLFPVADLWAPFSPYELDTLEKPGVDAARVLAYPRPGVEVDLALSPGTGGGDWSGGVRVTRELAAADVYGGGGRFGNQLILMAGMARVLERTTLRAELVQPWWTDEGIEMQPPRATLGADWMGGRHRITAEYHHNGLGRNDPALYREAVPRIADAGGYLLGRHYLGVAASRTLGVEERTSLSLSALWNLSDGSAALMPAASHDLGQSAALTLGGFLGLGPANRVLPAEPWIDFRSEFGGMGRIAFLRMTLFF
jgi:hypothetical protein